MIENGTNGFLVRAQDCQTLADRIIVLLRDPELRDRMGRVGRERYLQKFTLRQWLARLEYVFGRATQL